MIYLINSIQLNISLIKLLFRFVATPAAFADVYICTDTYKHCVYIKRVSLSLSVVVWGERKREKKRKSWCLSEAQLSIRL